MDDLIDKVEDVEFAPETRMIHVSWTLQNPSGNVIYFVVYYTRQDGQQRADYECSVNWPSVSTQESEDCLNDKLQPNSTYMISVQPFNETSGTGYGGSGQSDTLPISGGGKY